ncbi:MAG TPA: CehA/McbA family metallohydrolase [Armatimonadota bacterium]|nr:CehA/McbA family metallohydrolase [Armatimonadota bacterium]
MSELTNPYRPCKRWLRGNIHTHTSASDGEADPQTVVDWYAARGYDFLAITDHNVALPLTGLNSRGMILITGEELTHPHSHVAGLGVSKTLPRGESLQEQIDLIRNDDAIAIVAHPNWMGISAEQIEPLIGHLAIELSNQVCYRLNGKGDSVAWWDALLTRGQRCWGVAVDDMHCIATDAGYGSLLVDPDDCAWPALRAALNAGRFIATVGPHIDPIEVEGRCVHVASAECSSIRFVGREGRTLKLETSPSGGAARFTLPDDEPFVRVEVTDSKGRRAWTQPFWTI